MKITICVLVGLISFVIPSIYADSNVWKDDHGYSVYIPKYWSCDENVIFDWSCGSGYDHMLSQFQKDTKFTDPDLFNEREVSIMANERINLLSQGGQIIEKKSSNWFGTITQEYVVDSEVKRQLYKFIVKNDGYVYWMAFASPKNDFNKEGNRIIDSLKVLTKNDILKIEKQELQEKQKKIQDEKKKAADDLKNRLGQQKKAHEYQKKIQEERDVKKKAETIKQDELLKIPKQNIRIWQEKLDSLDSRFKILDISEYGKSVYGELHNKFTGSLSGYESAVKNVKKPTQEKINQIIKKYEPILTRKYNDLSSHLKSLEQHYQQSILSPTYDDEYERAYGKKIDIPQKGRRTAENR